jgi:hypothetical protein
MSAEMLNAAELAEIAEFIARDDHDSMCAAVGRFFGDAAAAYLRKKKPNKLGHKDPKKYARDLGKAELKGLFDYFIDEEKMERGDAFDTAFKIVRAAGKVSEGIPVTDVDVAEDAAYGKRGHITELSKTIHNPHVEARRASHASKPGMPSRQR